MRCIRTFLVLAACAALPLAAQEWAKARLEQSPRHREMVTINHDGRALSAFVAYPEASTKRPVVLVIHEIFGLSDWAQEVTDELAAAGYVAIAPDLLSGAGPNGGGTEALGGGTRHSRPQARTDRGRFERRRRLGAKAAGVEQEALCHWFLLGRRTEFHIFNRAERAERGVRVLWFDAKRGCPSQDHCAGVWILCRQRRTDQRHGSRDAREHGEAGQSL